MQELGRAMPILKTVLIDERDTYLTQKMRAAEGNKIVAVVGAGHVEGMAQALQEHRQVDLSKIEQIPPLSPVWTWLGWGIPALILGSIAYIGWDQGLQAAGSNLLFWLLACSTLSSIGTLLALGHPLTILSAFLSAPITVLSPVIGVGHVTALVQAYVQPPVVKEFQTVLDDISSFRKWWQNKLLRILLVFILSSIGGVIGTYIGTYEIVTNLF
jgi:pheromone shutdown-related protein TraB